MCLSRQNLPALANRANAERDIARGAYVLCDAADAAAAIIATGSELQLAVAAHESLLKQGIPTRVVSMPCSNVFDRQSQAYQNEVLPMDMPAVAVEAAHPDFWRKYVGRAGKVVGISTFGESAPAPVLYEHFSITAQAVEEAVQSVLEA